MIFKKVINFIYLNFPNIYIYLKKNIKKQINFPMNPHIFFKKNLNKNAIIVEAGAADGWDTLFFAKEFPNASIYSLEPVKELHETMVEMYYLKIKNIFSRLLIKIYKKENVKN